MGVEDASSLLLTVTLTVAVHTAVATGLLIVAPPSVGKELCNERLRSAGLPSPGVRSRCVCEGVLCVVLRLRTRCVCEGVWF